MKHKELLNLSFWIAFFILGCRSARNTDTTNSSKDSSWLNQSSGLTTTKEYLSAGSNDEEAYEYISVETPAAYSPSPHRDSTQLYDFGFDTSINSRSKERLNLLLNLPGGTKVIFGNGIKRETDTSQSTKLVINKNNSQQAGEVKTKGKEKITARQTETTPILTWLAVIAGIGGVIGLFLYFRYKK